VSSGVWEEAKLRIAGSFALFAHPNALHFLCSQRMGGRIGCFIHYRRGRRGPVLPLARSLAQSDAECFNTHEPDQVKEAANGNKAGGDLSQFHEVCKFRRIPPEVVKMDECSD
jgi:hypothetical protein